MNKLLTIIGFAVFSGLDAQDVHVVEFDDFRANKSGWEIYELEDATIELVGGALHMSVVEQGTVRSTAANLIGLAHHDYSIFEFDMSLETNEAISAGLFFQNQIDSENSERLEVILGKTGLWVVRRIDCLKEGEFTGASAAMNYEENFDACHVEIISDNRPDSIRKPTLSSEMTILINGNLVLESSWGISNFQEIGFICEGSGTASFDNLLISQTHETGYTLDALDFVFIDDKQIIDRSCLDSEVLRTYIPAELIGLEETYAPDLVELVADLKDNPLCRNFRENTYQMKGGTRDVLNFVYGEVEIELPANTRKANPISIYFLDEAALIKFYELYSRYHNFRLKDDRAQWPTSPWHAITINREALMATLWLGY